jgi:predicted RNA binding protein YcfA (HicA-like mRNA interferase family)
MAGTKCACADRIILVRRTEDTGTVTVPHPVRDVRPGTLKSIERQSGIRF